MKTKEFLNKLKSNSTKELIFEYASNLLVGANYHITEVKNVTINSVDCGGKENNWEETIVQLWESPKEIGKRTYMKSNKAIEIFDRVNSIKPLLLDTEIKIEYGNKSFHTANLVVHSIEEFSDNIIVKLHTDKTQCKAINPKEKVKTSLASLSNCC